MHWYRCIFTVICVEDYAFVQFHNSKVSTLVNKRHVLLSRYFIPFILIILYRYAEKWSTQLRFSLLYFIFLRKALCIILKIASHHYNGIWINIYRTCAETENDIAYLVERNVEWRDFLDHIYTYNSYILNANFVIYLFCIFEILYYISINFTRW